MYFTRLRFITHLDCLSHASLFGNSALSCIKMNVCGCILLERGIYTFVAVYRLVVRQQKRSRSCSHSRTATDRFRCDGS